MDKIKQRVKALPAPTRTEVYDASAKPKKKRDDDEAPVKKKKKKQVDASRAAALYEEEHPAKKRKRVVEDDDDPVKKTTAIALADDGLPKLSKLKGKALRTQFGTGTEKILRLLEQDETDPAIALIYKRLLQSVVDVLPLAEMGIRASKGVRGVHGFNMLISSLRELMVDVQQAQDRGMMGEMLVQQVIQPAFYDLAQDTVLEFSNLASDAKIMLDAQTYERFATLLRETRVRLATRMNGHYATMRDGTISYLQR